MNNDQDNDVESLVSNTTIIPLPLSKAKCFLKTCEKGGDFTCCGCNVIMYCSKECQKVDWPCHKLLCFTPKETYIPRHIKTFKGHGEKDLIIPYSFYSDLKVIHPNDCIISGGEGNGEYNDKCIPQWFLFLQPDGKMKISIAAKDKQVCTYQEMDHLGRLKCMDPVENVLFYYTPQIMSVYDQKPFK
jgi:hypothetical protein